MKYLILTLIILSSCSKDYRATRKINKLKEWGYLKTDTITKFDTIRGFKLDTLVKYHDTTLVDTLFIVKDGVKVKTIVKWKEKIVEQSITKTDTIVKTKYVETKLLDCPQRKWWDYWYWGAIFALTLFALLVFAAYKLKNIK